MVGTPGLGVGSFVRFGHEGITPNIRPVVEIPFPGNNGKTVPLKTALDKRCWGDRFHGAVRIPSSATNSQAQVTVAFPGWQLGKLTPATFDISVIDSLQFERAEIVD